MKQGEAPGTNKVQTPNTSQDLHGSVPDQHSLALLVIDVLNDLNFEDGDDLLEPFQAICPPLEKLITSAREARVPVIYINDNFGKWRSDFKTQISNCISGKSKTRLCLQKLLPEADDYYILKPKHSGFYASPLDLVLKSLGSKTLVITGLTAESCVLFTAADAYVRDYEVILAGDCIASFSDQKKNHAFSLMKESFRAKLIDSSALDWNELREANAQD